MRQSRTAIIAIAVAIATPACATKGYVERHVKTISDKVDTLAGSVEETQDRTRRAEDSLGQVDQRTQAAQATASQAQQAAGKAGADATSAAGQAAAAQALAGEVDTNAKRLVYTVILSNDEGNFKSGDTSLPDEAKAKIDELVTQLKADPKGAYFEIEGHTDSIGPKKLNEQIGLQRAEVVKRYLYEQHQIPLHKMNVISYGPARPAAPNTNRQGRAQNRRVVIKVLV